MAAPPESITYLEPVDWLQVFLSIFKDDTKYGFANRVNPDDNVFQAYNVIQSMPEVSGNLPAIWVVCERKEPLGEQGYASFIKHFTAFIDIYAVVFKDHRLPYNGKIWSVPNVHDPNAPNNLLFLLEWYIGNKLKDNVEIRDTGVLLMPKGWTDGEYYYLPVAGLMDTRGVRVQMAVEVQIE